MASSQDNVSMALFCDFENVALGVRDANYEQFDIKPILERLLLKGSIVIKKAYCDWDRYKAFKKPMHEANFELIEIPHVRQSGKNSADIRLVVDALDLCYTKSHVNTFVIISGDSDFSPLVSKLRENNKQVIGVGVKQSTSDLLVANCDEFIFYDDLVRENQRRAAKRSSTGARDAQPAANRSPDEERRRKDDVATRRSKAIELAVETFDALVLERGDGGKMWASVLKEAIKRRKPDFNESYYGFRAFGNLLEEAQARGLLEFGRDEKSGTYVYRGNGGLTDVEPGSALEGESAMEAAAAAVNGRREPREPREARKRGGRKSSSRAREDFAAPAAEGAWDAQADLPLAADGAERGPRDGLDADDAGTARDAVDDDADVSPDAIADEGNDSTLVAGADYADVDSQTADDTPVAADPQEEDSRWPDVRDESPIAPWDALPVRSAPRRQQNPFEASSDEDTGDTADDQGNDAANAAPRKGSLVPARKRARDKSRGRGRDGKTDMPALSGSGPTPDLTVAHSVPPAPTPAATPAPTTSAAAPFIGNATLLPFDAPTPGPSKAVVTRAPRRRSTRVAVNADEQATESASPANKVDAPTGDAPAPRGEGKAPKAADNDNADTATSPKPAARKAATRTRRPRKTASTPDAG